ncbi:MAG: Fe-S cluster assembly protein SufB, partial [Bacteroidota bacterium]
MRGDLSNPVPEVNEHSNEEVLLNQWAEQDYAFGFVSDIEQDIVPKGLNEEVIRWISARKEEPSWLLDWRLKAYRHWLSMPTPEWAHLEIPAIDFQDISYYAAPKAAAKLNSLDELDPEIKSTYDKLGIPLEEQLILAGVAVDAVLDSVSVVTTYKEKLAEKGIIFCSFSEAVREHPDLVRKHLGKVVPYTDNYYAALNSAVFSDGSFVYIPQGVRC